MLVQSCNLLNVIPQAVLSDVCGKVVSRLQACAKTLQRISPHDLAILVEDAAVRHLLAVFDVEADCDAAARIVQGRGGRRSGEAAACCCTLCVWPCCDNCWLLCDVQQIVVSPQGVCRAGLEDVAVRRRWLLDPLYPA